MTPQELKNSILQRAIQGKLVEQRPEEGTAEELYQQIQAEKQALIKAGKIKKEKPLPEIAEDEKPFDIPESWKWVKLGSIVSVFGGKRISAGRKLSLEDTGYIYIRVSDMKDGYVSTENLQYVPQDIYPSISRYIINKEDVFITVAGTIGRVGKIPHELDGANLTENADRLVFSDLDQDWLIKCLQSSVVQNQIAYATTKVGQPKLAIVRIQNMIIPLPPLAEQKRIVAKIEELLPLIDRYEAAWSRLEEFNKRFPGDMQKSLLQMAIQGKLVPQRPEEGTGEELFRQIQTEKQALIKAGKIKKDKLLPEITDDEKPFEIPESWKWVRVGSLIHEIQTGKSIKCEEVPPEDGQCGILKVSAVTWGKYQEEESKTCFSNDQWVEEYAVCVNDFLICRANTKALVGGCVVVGAVSKRLMLSDKILRLCFDSAVYKPFLLWSMRSPLSRTQLSAAATGTSDSMKNISQDAIRNVVVPLPPLAEQKRIVAKLEELLPLCEKLK